jgi:hypothetical protein
MENNSPGDDAKTQVGLAMSAMAMAFVQTLREINPDPKRTEDVLAVLQRKVSVQYALLRQAPNAEAARSIFSVVRDTFRDLKITEQDD